jgi:SAM-dependent methyltransferase
MADVPVDFVADLRNLRRWPDLVDSLWRSPALVELTYGRLWHLVAEVLPATPVRILDVGCGSGALSLELARAGHDVTAIDPDPTAIELAERTVHDRRPGRLAYHQGDMATWAADEASFDLVVTTRTLHHVPEPAAALERIRHWLRPGGRLVCVDFFHDRFDHRAARWLAQVRGLLEATGSYRQDGRLPAEPYAAVERIEWEWEQDHIVEQQLNRTAEIEEPLGRLFRTDARSWHPYLYWDVLVGLEASSVEAEQATASLVAAWEASLLAASELSPVLLRFVGSRDE